MPSTTLKSGGEFILSSENCPAKLTQKGLTGSDVIALEHWIGDEWVAVEDANGAVELAVGRKSVAIQTPGRYRAVPGANTVQLDY